MTFLEMLGLVKKGRGKTAADDEAQSLEPIASQLQELEPQRARFLAAFAMVLARAARADLEISEVEAQSMVEIIAEEGDLPTEQAALVSELAAHRIVRLGATEDYLATREFKRLASPEERRRMLDCLFAVCAADDSVSLIEEEQVRQVATELGLEHADYIAARKKVSDKREVMRGLPRPSRSNRNR
jgi:uncharacterized tellurite resistance protein B-like protein